MYFQVIRKAILSAFIHADHNTDHERKVEEIARRVGFDFVSISSELSPNIKVLSRATSSCADAYLSPLVKRYVDGFTASFSSPPGRIEFMQSDGGLSVGSKFSGLKAILSGPAGGVVAIAATCYNANEGTPVIGFDMVRVECPGIESPLSYKGRYEYRCLSLCWAL